jgi:hypothetical protein
MPADAASLAELEGVLVISLLLQRVEKLAALIG